MNMINHIMSEVSAKFQADLDNIQNQIDCAHDEMARTRAGEINMHALGRVTVAAARLAFLVASVAMAALAAAQIPALIAGGAMSPIVGLALYSAVLYVGHHKLVENDPYAVSVNSVTTQWKNQFSNFFNRLLNYSLPVTR